MKEGALMQRVMLKSKIHRATVSAAALHYVGSLTVDAALLEAADIIEHEQIHVLNVANGARFETYAMAGERGSGEMKVNGAAARLAHPGDTIIVLSYGLYDRDELTGYRPVVVHVDQFNAPTTRDPMTLDLDGDEAALGRTGARQ